MNEPSEPLSAEDAADLKRLRIQVRELSGMVRLILLGLVITTSGLCLFMYRQAKLLRFQVIAQQETVARAEAAVAPAMQMIPRFKRVGELHPDYASNILSRFGLTSIPQTNTAVATPASAK